MKRDALRAHYLFQSLRAEEIDEIIGFATERRIARGATIFEKGDPGTSLMAVLLGSVRISNIAADGSEVFFRVIGAGEVFGEIALLDGKPRSADAVALEDTLLIVVERRHFFPFMLRHPSVLERLLVVLCDRMRSTSLDLQDQATLEVPVRLARRLVRLAEQYGQPVPQGGIRIEMKLSDTDLGRLIGNVKRETVNRHIRVWRREGLMDYEGSYRVIHDLAGLRARGD
jgi:CRP-like cAMP-binding protein